MAKLIAVWLLVLSIAGCGRIGFSPFGDDGGSSGDGAVTVVDSPIAPDGSPVMFACDDARVFPAASAPLGGEPTFVATGTHLIALWRDSNGNLARTTWQRSPLGLVLASHGDVVRAGPIGVHAAAATATQVLVAYDDGSDLYTLVLSSDGSPAGIPALVGNFRLGSSDSLVADATSGTFRAVSRGARAHRFAADGTQIGSTPLGSLASHTEIAISAIGNTLRVYSVIDNGAPTYHDEYATMLSASDAIVAGPSPIENDQAENYQIAAPPVVASLATAASASLSADPVETYVYLYAGTGTPAATVIAGATGSGIGRPRIAVNSAGPVSVVRTPSGMRVLFVSKPTRILSPTAERVALANADDEIYVAMFEPNGTPSLTRLCP